MGAVRARRNRYRACAAAGVEPRYQEWDGQGSLVSFVLSLNLKRRHLTAAQKAAVATDVLPMLEAEARERQGTRSDLTQKFEEGSAGEAAEQAAKVTGTNRQYIYDAKRIAEQAPDVLDDMRAGAVTMPQAKALAALPPRGALGA